MDIKRTFKKDHGHILYSCAYSKGKENTGCFAGKADNRILELFILNEIKAHLQEIIGGDQIETIVRQKYRQQIQTYQYDIAACKEMQEQLKKQRLQNYESYHEGELDQKQFQYAREQIELEKDKLQKQIQKLEALMKAEEKKLHKKNIPVEQMIEYLGYEKLTREMLEKYVEEVYVHDDGRIEINYKLIL